MDIEGCGPTANKFKNWPTKLFSSSDGSCGAFEVQKERGRPGNEATGVLGVGVTQPGTYILQCSDEVTGFPRRCFGITVD